MHIYLSIAHCCPLQKYALLSFCSGASILTAGAVLDQIFWNCVGVGIIPGFQGHLEMTTSQLSFHLLKQ